MKISDMETLLQQEMEAVKGGSGTVRVCKCKVYSSCKQSMGKRVCYMDIVKTGVLHDGPDPRCPEAPDTDKIL